MKALGFKDVLQLLPLDESVKQEILEKYDKGDKVDKIALQRAIWKAYFDYKEELERLKYEELLNEVSQGKRELNGDLGKEARKLVRQDFKNKLLGKQPESEELSSVRSKIKNLM